MKGREFVLSRRVGATADPPLGEAGNHTPRRPPDPAAQAVQVAGMASSESERPLPDRGAGTDFARDQAADGAGRKGVSAVAATRPPLAATAMGSKDALRGPEERAAISVCYSGSTWRNPG